MVLELDIDKWIIRKGFLLLVICLYQIPCNFDIILPTVVEEQAGRSSDEQNNQPQSEQTPDIKENVSPDERPVTTEVCTIFKKAFE